MSNKVSALDLNDDLSENLKYNQEEFPARIMESRLSVFDRYAAEAHWHNDFEFLWVVDGSLSYFVNGATAELGTGMGIFVNSRRLHYGFSKTQDECLYRFAVIDPEILMQNACVTSKWMLPLMRGADYRVLSPERPADAAVLDLLGQMFKAGMAPKEGYELTVLGLLALVTSRLIADMRPPEQKPREQDDAEFKAMFAFCQEHFAEKLTVAQIARAGTICESKCNRLFKQYLGQTPVQYIRQLRVQKSVRLLVESDLSVTEIALECGFSGLSYYIETFSDIIGMTPRDFRRQYCGN